VQPLLFGSGDTMLYEVRLLYRGSEVPTHLDAKSLLDSDKLCINCDSSKTNGLSSLNLGTLIIPLVFRG
jgi:hypothetical protein